MISASSSSESVGRTAEVYVPSTGQHCQLPDLPDWRYDHSQDVKTLCGGSYNTDTRTSCLTLTVDGWEKTTTLLESRQSD